MNSLRHGAPLVTPAPERTDDAPLISDGLAFALYLGVVVLVLGLGAVL